MSYRTAPATHSGASYDASPAVPPSSDPLAAMAAQLTPKRAVSYIRVSTREQAQRGGSEEGFSLPAQREANKKKAASMGALVVKEFADRGESARSANRPELQKMLTYLKEDGGIDYVIVHKLDRLARNRADDVEINRAFEQAGVRLVSTSENIDQTPGGMLLHGIMSSIAEFYSRNLANEVLKGMGEKARNGGTLGKAPLGYINVRAKDEHGREIRTVALDEERAPLIRLAFTEYATGNWTVSQLATHLAGLGLDLPATPTKPAKPITKGRLHTLLRHPYYKGIVTFQGVEYPGRHQALVDAATWQTVQDIMDSHRNGERQRLHNHHLKTTIACGLCGARLLVQNAKNGRGVIYPYFVCARRHRTHDCTFRAVLIEKVEEQVTDLYKTIQLSHTDRRAVEHHLLAELEHIEKNSAHDIRSLTTRRTNLEDQRRQLLQAHYKGAVPLELLKEEQNRLTRELTAIQHHLNGYHADAHKVRQHLTQALDLLQDCHRLYQAAPNHLKKLLNTVFFERVLVNPAVDEDGRVILPGGQNPTEDSAEQDPRGSTAQESTDRAKGEVAGTAGRVSSGDGDRSEAPAAAVDDEPQTEPPARPPLLIRDSSSRTSAAGYLAWPFDQLTSHGLHHAAQQYTQAVTSDDGSSYDAAGGPGSPHSLYTASSQRKTPTPEGERASSSETAPDTISHSACSYRSVVVRKKGLEPSRPKAPEPKSGASTNSATRATRLTLPSRSPGMVEKSADIAGCPDAVAGQLRRAVGATAMEISSPPQGAVTE